MTEVQRCPRACGQVVLWVLTHGGHRRACDPDPHPAGTVTVETLADGTVRGRMLPGDELPAFVPAYRLHDRTCPVTARGPVDRCVGCRDALNGVLAALGGWYGRYHPTCAPAVRPTEQETPA